MQKIISLFQRNYETDKLVRDEVVPGAEWVLAGEGIATRKWDGTCCMVRDGRLFKRYEVKPGKQPPAGFEPANDVDETTGKQQGWMEVGDGPDDRWHREAWSEATRFGNPPFDGTYELLGPKINGNPEGEDRHCLVRHGLGLLEGEFARTFDGIKAFLSEHDIEGIVWHHIDGRMVKIKGRDFGIKRKQTVAS